MASSKVERKNFAIKFHYHDCDGCKKTVKELRQIEGVESIESDPGLKYRTILGTGDPDPIIKKLKKNNKNRWVELSREPTSARNDQKMQIALPEKPVRVIHENPGTVEPATVMKELEKHRTKVALLSEESPPLNNHQEMQIVSQQKPVPKVNKMVASQPGHEFTGIAPKALDKSVVKKTHDCYRNQNHELELKRYNKRFTCDGCKEDGFGYRYRCEQCDYELHKDCKFPKTTISPKLFQGSTFEFCQNSYYKGQERCCDACGKYIYGYSYHCKAKDLDLHPRCSNLEDKLSVGGTVFVLRNKKLSKCKWCEKRGSSGTRGRVPGCSYVSACKNYQFHVYCITEMVHEAWKKGATDDTEDTSMALEPVDLQLMAKNSSRNGGRGRDQFLKTLKIFIGTIIAILLGDPTALLASTVVGLLSN